MLIVDDHPVFCQGLRRILESVPDIDVVDMARDGEEALDMARELTPDVILMDINLPSMNGMQVTRLIKAELPNIAVIMLTAYHDESQVLHAIRAGASAYYPKDVTPDKLVDAIRQVSEGMYVIEEHVLTQPELARWIQARFEEIDAFWEGAEEMFMPLSSREMEILQLIARGKSNKAIALELGISHQTVKNHMTSILRKLAVNDRTQAAIYALRKGWIRLQDTET
ncbi:MAG: response regulator transcription factor [Anaerolineae bacterium]|nr:response regulator transcription factor [Anaerolineae bacterium]